MLPTDNMCRNLFFVVVILLAFSGNTFSQEDRYNYECNYHGVSVDGKCDCESGYYGRECECPGGESHPNACFRPNTTMICSGRGDCICGKCDCHTIRSNSPQKYSGKYCQCDDYSCPYHDNALCGGPTHGICECGVCRCLTGFTADNCGCSTNSVGCISSDGSLCSGRGECQCNRCVCQSRYKGPTCEDCKGCAPMVCHELRRCVQCLAFGTGPLRDNCQECQKRNYIYITDVIPAGYNSCQYKDEDDDCLYFFSYDYDEFNHIEVSVQRTKECPAPHNSATTFAYMTTVPIVIHMLFL